jgi:hypothetical protein
MNSSFRAELNVGKETPVPRVEDLMAKEELSANKTLSDMEEVSAADCMSPFINMRVTHSPEKAEEERHESQLRLNKWFPV